MENPFLPPLISVPPEIESELSCFTRTVIPTPEGRLHVMTCPGEGRPVLMLHGNPTWGFLYRKVVRELTGTSLRMVVPDLLGLGLSERIAPEDHTLEKHGRAIASLVATLDLRDMIFVGQDWGGPIGLWAMAQTPERVRGLVILNTVVCPPRIGFRPTLFHRFGRVPLLSDLVFRGLGFPLGWLHTAQGDRSSIRGATARAYRWPFVYDRDNSAILALTRMVPNNQKHPSIPGLQAVEAFVRGFRGPSGIVWGDKDPVLARAFRRTHAALPHAKVWHTAAGHFLQEEVPDVIAAAIRWVDDQLGATTPTDDGVHHA